MVSSAAVTVNEYLLQLPAERRTVVAAVRDLVNANLPPGYVEAMTSGMIGWSVPLSRYSSPTTGSRWPTSALPPRRTAIRFT